MSVSSSESRLKTGFATVIGGLAVTALLFYWIQNARLLPGAQVAPVKTARLARAILFWLLMLDRRMPP
jgi:hypothetical protein